MNEERGTTMDIPEWDGWVGTNTGRKISLSMPDPNEIDIEDIARGLANSCRFTGQIERWYSVAEHCIQVARLLPPHLRLVGLLHDAAEAYVSDVSSPLKRALGANYRKIENAIAMAIGQRFGLGDALVYLPQAVKDADKIMLMTERDALVRVQRNDWGDDYENCVRHPNFMRTYDTPDGAYNAYLQAFAEFGGVR